MIPVLETERLVMRGWSASDFEPFARAYADADTARYIGGVADRRLAWGHMAFHIGHWALRGFGLWVVETRDAHAFAGWSGLFFPEGAAEPEISWVLVPAARGRGYATEAAARARSHAFDTLGWSTAVSGITLANTASIRVADRLGARLERTIEHRDGERGIFRHPGPDGTFAGAKP
jgi:RimJ/RimL family protein N-acetyltransferase